MAYDFNSLTKQAPEATNRDGFYTDFEDVDPSKLHQISELTEWMRTKAKGSDVREVIAQLFERTWVEGIKEGNANLEVAQARGGYPNLKSRLDNVDNKQQKTTEQLAQKANKNEVTNVMTPKGTLPYASLPTSGNQVGWYYYCPDGDGVHGAGNYVWNGSSWFFGGTGDEGYNLLKKDLIDLRDCVGYKTNYEVMPNCYIDVHGVVSQYSAFDSSKPIKVFAGDKVKLEGQGYEYNVAMISLTDETGSYYTPKVSSSGNTVKTYEYTVLEDGFIAISYENTKTHNLLISSTFSNKELEKNIDVLKNELGNIGVESNINYGVTNNYFIQRDGAKVSNWGYVYSNPIELKRGYSIELVGQGYTTNVAMISTCDEDGNNISVKVISKSSDVETYSYKAYEDCYVVLSYFGQSMHLATIYTDYSNKELLNSSYKNCDLSCFEDVAVVGDSYASGAIDINGSVLDRPKKSWLQGLARKYGFVGHNFSKGGLHTRTWLTDGNGLSKLLSTDSSELYLCNLGINDYFSLGDSYIGTISDIKDDYTQNADTFYGNYGKIISNIKAHSPNAKIVLFEIAMTGTIFNNFNVAIRNIAKHFNIPCINLHNDVYFNSTYYNQTQMKNGHPTIKGYVGMSCAIDRLLSNEIENNSYFNNLFMY